VGNPHVGFDEAGTGNGLMSTAPVLDPTDVAGVGNVARTRCCDTRKRKSETTGNTNFGLNRRASSRPYLQRDRGTTEGMAVILWHRRETRRQTENTNFSL
jgi:hypothetical protein